MTDQQPEYGDRPEVETSDTEVVQGADGPPADQPAVSAEDQQTARNASAILSLGEEQAHAYAEDPSAYLAQRARIIAATDPRPEVLADDSGVEVEPSGQMSSFTKGYTASLTGELPPAVEEDSLDITLYRADGARLSFSSSWPAGSKETLAQVRALTLLMEEAVEGGQ